MVALYVTSVEKGSGKTTVCAGLGKRFLNEGKKVGYLKPIVTESEKTRMPDADSDTVFFKQLLSLDETLDILCPVISNRGNMIDNIKEAYAKASSGKDIVFIEGPSEQYLTSGDIVTALNARVLIVETYSQDLKKISSYSGFKQSLLGVVVNKVPKSRIEQTRREMLTQLDESKINILGVLPEDRSLLALTIGELAERIQGEILRGEDQSSELVENLMLGAMTVDSGLDYFNRKGNKAVVVKSERPDMQLAALQTPTKCLVLTGDTAPRSVVFDRAEEKNIPIILARNSTTTVVKIIQDALVGSKFNQDKKLSKLEKLIEQNFDFQKLYKELGLGG